jgi:hypothetical protein
MQCGQKISSSAKSCPNCGAQQTQSAVGKSIPLHAASLPASTLPDGVKGWSWGAFWFSWIWAIFNKTWIGLLALIPLVNIVMMVILGLKGREWAWKNNAWSSVDYFNRVQRKWSIAGWIIMVVALLSGVTIGVLEDRMKHSSNGESDTNWSLDEDASKDVPASSKSERSDTPPPQATSVYPMPGMGFEKVDLLGAMKRAGIEQHWVSHFTKYLSEPEIFWQECVAQEAGTAKILGGMDQDAAQAHGESVCQGLVQQHYTCLNGKSLDDAVMCLQVHINDVAENGE